MRKEEERQYCYDPQPLGGRQESVSVRGNRRNRREQLNEYWRDQRTSIRQARVRSELRLVGPEVFLSNPQLLRQVKSWIDIAGVDYARKALAKTGVNAEGIEMIVETALRVRLAQSVT